MPAPFLRWQAKHLAGAANGRVRIFTSPPLTHRR